MNKKIKIIIFILIIITVGIFIYFLWPTLFELKEEAEVGPGQEILELMLTLGEVEDVISNEVRIRIEKFDDIPLPDKEKKYDYMTFLLNEKTKFYQYTDTIKSQEEFNKEQEEFNKKIKEFKTLGRETTGIEAPSWYILKEIIKDDLIKGQVVRIYSYQQNQDSVVNKIVVKRTATFQKSLDISSQAENTIELFGRIKEINDKFLTLDEYNPNPTSQSIFIGTRDIAVNNLTKIIKKVKKTDQQFQKEQNEFNAKVSQLKKEGKDVINISAPDWFIEQEIEFSDLEVGVDAMIEAMKTVDEEIIAQKIELVTK